MVDHNKKVVQMHMLACNFTLQLKEEVMKDEIKAMEYGEHLKYRKIFLGVTVTTQLPELPNELLLVSALLHSQPILYIKFNEGKNVY